VPLPSLPWKEFLLWPKVASMNMVAAHWDMDMPCTLPVLPFSLTEEAGWEDGKPECRADPAHFRNAASCTFSIAF
jgi:hypothetical protein